MGMVVQEIKRFMDVIWLDTDVGMKRCEMAVQCLIGMVFLRITRDEPQFYSVIRVDWQSLWGKWTLRCMIDC